MKKLINFFKEEEGATAVEYGIMVALIAVVIIVTVGLLGGALNVVFKKVETSLTSAAAS
jgi:pilus assembly protein Flp/PilA